MPKKKLEDKKPKKYLVKTVNNTNGTETQISAKELALEKLAYDLLKYLWVNVPKTYLVLDVSRKNIIGLAIEYNEEAKELRSFLKNPNSPNARAKIFHSKKINNKPIKDLYSWLAQFVLIFDPGAIGLEFTNILLVEKEDHFKAYKVDLSKACLGKTFSDDLNPQGISSIDFFYDNSGDERSGLSHDFKKDGILKAFSGRADWCFKELYKFATQGEILSSLVRVCKSDLKDFHTIIYNPRIPDSALSLEVRKEIETNLSLRLNRLREFYASELQNFQGSVDSPDIKKCHQVRYFLTIHNEIRNTNKRPTTTSSTPSTCFIYEKIPNPSKKIENHPVILSQLQTTVDTACENYYRGLSKFSLFHGRAGKQRAASLKQNIQEKSGLIDALELLIKHFQREEGVIFKHRGRLRDDSLDTILLSVLLTHSELTKSLLLNGITFPQEEERYMMRERVIEALQIPFRKKTI